MEYNKTFYEDVLKNFFGDTGLTVHSISEEPATAKGDNFLSSMFRVRIEFTSISSFLEDSVCPVRKTRSFILKLEPDNDPKLLSLIRDQKLFTVELHVLRDLLPRMEAALDFRLGPKLVYGNNDPPQAIIMMEDLGSEGYRMKNRSQGLSMAHASMAIKNLARFHAGSVALAEEDPEALKSIRQGIFCSTTPLNFYVLTTNSLLRLSEVATTWSHEGCALAAQKIRAIIDSVKDRVQDIYNYKDDEFCVLNHGDAWINNMLFVEDESGKPLKQVFVDYQMSSYSSPAIDLLYFLGINPALEVRNQGEKELLDIYLETLSISMEKLRCKTEPPTMRQLKEAMYRRRIYSVFASLFLLPRMKLPKDEIETMEELLKHGTTKIDVYGNPDVVNLMKKVLPAMDKRGYLDP